MASEMAQGGRLRLHLSESLGSDWHDYPYEWLRLNNAPLLGSLLVERHAPALFQPLAPIDPEREIVVLNLLGSDDPIQPVDEIPNGISRVIDGHAAADHFLRQADLEALGALVVVAHGTERVGETPFRLPDGSTWSLPTNRGLPPWVVLLACGNDEGNLIVDAQRLLRNGAMTVLAPVGRPGPAEAGSFLAKAFTEWRGGRRIDDTLADAQGQPSARRGACLLRLVGRGDLRMSASPELPQLSDSNLAETVRAGSSDALAVLVNRLTLQCFQAGKELEEAEDRLRALLQVRRYDEAAERWLLDQLGAQEIGLWPLSEAWLRPLEAALAEAYDHGRLHRLAQVRRALEGAGIAMPAPVYHYWSRISYRLGHYVPALQDVARGLAQLGPDTLCTRSAGLVGHLAGLLIDVDLPEPAERLHQALTDCLVQRNDEKAEWEQHKLKDRGARIALRRGRPERARAIYWAKREDSCRRFGGNGDRELAWLLYIDSWANPERGRSLAAEARERLGDAKALGQQLGSGNDDNAYLLRAFAAWAWRAEDEAACRYILELSDVLEPRLYSGDPGPFGFVYLYLHLCRKSGMALERTLPPLDAVTAALEQGRYFLELAGFAALLSTEEEVLPFLERVQAQRIPRDALVFPDWLADGALSDWETLVAHRAAYERRALAGKGAVTPEKLLESGLLPL